MQIISIDDDDDDDDIFRAYDEEMKRPRRLI